MYILEMDRIGEQRRGNSKMASTDVTRQHLKCIEGSCSVREKKRTTAMT